jgi:hypothetical protein
MNNGLTKRGSHIRVRRYRGILGKRPDLKQLRRESAVKRKAAYDALTPAQKLKLLDDDCRRAIKQRARLAPLVAAQLEAEQAKPAKQQPQKKPAPRR